MILKTIITYQIKSLAEFLQLIKLLKLILNKDWKMKLKQWLIEVFLLEEVEIIEFFIKLFQMKSLIMRVMKIIMKTSYLNIMIQTFEKGKDSNITRPLTIFKNKDPWYNNKEIMH